jgi:hypothetical protein
MIEADIEHSHFTETDGLRYNILGTSSTKKGQLVTYDYFLAEYWPHFPQRISRNFRSSLFLLHIYFTFYLLHVLAPLLIFNEFIGL